jgi:DNA-binding HxlR family transcriptional regulator
MADFRCGLEAVLYLVGAPDPLPPERRGELQRRLGGVSMKMLSQWLKEMASHGIFRRIDRKTVPPHVEYEMTKFGYDLARAVEPLCEWGTKHMREVEAISRKRSPKAA